MQKQQALEILNSMPIIDTDNDGEAMIYIYVENSQENREKVMSLGFSEKDILDALYDYNENKDVIDLNHFAWDFAEWFDGNEFLEYAPVPQ